MPRSWRQQIGQRERAGELWIEIEVDVHLLPPALDVHATVDRPGAGGVEAVPEPIQRILRHGSVRGLVHRPHERRTIVIERP